MKSREGKLMSDLKDEQNMTGKVCLITGGSSGIGKATALALARMGAEVVILGKDQDRGEAAVAEIKTITNNPKVEFLACDLASLASVRQAAQTFKQKHSKLQVLINNAGVFMNKRVQTVDGFEATWEINYLSHFLLTHLLLDLLTASAPSRIINVASKHQGTKMNFDDLSFEKNYSIMKAVGQTKLGLILFSQALSKKLAGTGVSVNSLHPGIVKSNLLNNMPWYIKIVELIGVTPEQGARTAVYLASSSEVENVTGKFFNKSREERTVGQANDVRAEERLWKVSLEQTGLDGNKSYG